MTPQPPLRMVIAESRDLVRHGLRAVLSALRRFTGGAPAQDDITLVVLAHRG